MQPPAFRNGGSEPQALLSAILSQLPAPLPKLDERTLSKLREQALRRAADLQQQASHSARQGLLGARVLAADLARGDAQLAGWRVGGAVHRASTSPAMRYLARMLVCLYFLNSVWERLETWRYMQQPEMVAHRQRWPEHYPDVGFPSLGLGLLLPCALAAALGIRVLQTSTVLLAWELSDSASLVASQLAMLLLNGVKPTELVVKRLAMVGCTALVVASGMKEQRLQISSYAGLLLSGDSQRRPSRWKSLLLLLGRLLMAALFIYVGVSQIQRVVARDFILFQHLPHSQLWERDGHDNNWLLLEFMLALPFAAGFKTAPVSRLLAATLVAEAVTCWRPWAGWPTQTYAAHVRLHFVTNLSVAGGLLLLASYGAGQYTMDSWLKTKKQV